MKPRDILSTCKFEEIAMQHSEPTNYDPARRKTFGLMLLVFSVPPLFAVLGFVTAGALGYAPF
jgi:hypothetical protein